MTACPKMVTNRREMVTFGKTQKNFISAYFKRYFYSNVPLKLSQ